jgi:preprotein translocase subunit SecF
VFTLVPPDTQFDFLGKKRVAPLLSLAIILAGLVAIPIRGIRTGIDFAGGTEIQLAFPEASGADEAKLRAALGKAGVEGGDVIRFGGGGDSRDFLVRLAGEVPPIAGGPPPAEAAAPAEGAPAEPATSEITPEERKRRMTALEAAFEAELGPVEVERVEFVGPRVGAELRRDGLWAVILSWVVILLYIGFRFSLRYGPGAVVALVHDVLVTCAIWLVFGLEFDLQVLAALLTIIGYSVNDTIVMFDRVRENLNLRTRRELEEVVNRSINETLSRTLLTAGTVFLSCLALVLVGGPVIRPFSLAMLIGVVAGTYSTIYMAAPVMIWFEEKFPSTATAAAPAKAKAKA